MNEFSEMMSPFQKEYKVLLNCRIDKGAVLNLDIDKVLFFFWLTGSCLLWRRGGLCGMFTRR